MKKIIIVIISFLLIFNCSFALSLGEALQKLPIIEENKLQKELDIRSLQGVIDAQYGASDFLKIDKRYGLGTSEHKRLEMKIAKETSLEKAKLGNKIKKMQYSLAENASVIGVRGLYTAALAAKGEYELSNLHYAVAKNNYVLAVKQLKNGDITEYQYKEKQIELNQAANVEALARIDYESYKQKLSVLLGVDVEIAPEQPRLDPLQSLDYYKAGIGNQITVKAPELQNQIIELDFEFYEDRFLIQNEKIERAYDDLWREYKTNKLAIKAAKLAAEKDIEKAYFDVNNMYLQTKSLQDNLFALDQRLVQMEELYQAGLIAENKLNQLKIQHKQLENAYHLASFSLNTKRQALVMATSVGPSYQESGVQ